MSKSKHPKQKAQEVGIPDSFLFKMSGLLKDGFPQFASSLKQKPLNGLRVNTLKISSADFLAISPYPISPVPWCKDGFYIEADEQENFYPPPGKHPFHHAGLYYLQEPSAMAAAEILSPQPGEKVLDIAAAPGGKTTHLASLMQGLGILVANEVHPKRVWVLAENLERCGVKNTVVLNATSEKISEHFLDYFDRVLVDAPCSGEGMFRKNDSARKEWAPELPQSCSIRQKSILDQASLVLKPGGNLLYSTCTFSPEENEAVIAAFLDDHPEFEIKESSLSTVLRPAQPEWIGLPKHHRLDKAIRVWPHLHKGEGHFLALLVKKDSPKSLRQNQDERVGSSHQKSLEKASRYQMKLWQEFATENLNVSIDPSQLSIEGSYLYLENEYHADLSGLRVIHPGWWLGSFNKNRFVPSHALAMGVNSEQAKRVISFQVDDKLISSYLSGQSFLNEGEDGWVLICVSQYALGWGKRTKNLVKNYYPHGLRINS